MTLSASFEPISEAFPVQRGALLPSTASTRSHDEVRPRRWQVAVGVLAGLLAGAALVGAVAVGTSTGSSHAASTASTASARP